MCCIAGSLKSTHNNALEISESAKTRVDLVDELKTSPGPNTNWKEEEVEEIFYGKAEEVEVEAGRVFGHNDQEEQGRRSIFRQEEEEEHEEGRISSDVPIRATQEGADNNDRVRSGKSAKLTAPKSATGGRPSFSTGRPGSSSSKNGGRMRRKKTPKKRCAHVECNKRINITNGFTCRYVSKLLGHNSITVYCYYCCGF